MASELEDIMDTLVPTLATIANNDTFLIYDASGTSGNKIKEITYLTVETAIKATLDAAYGDYVARWPTWSEVTNKPFLSGKAVQASPTGSYDIDIQSGDCFILTLSDNLAIDVDVSTDNGNSGVFTLILVQDGAGAHVPTWGGNATFYFEAANPPTLTSAGNSIDILTFYYDGSSNKAYYAGSAINLQ